MSLASKIRAKQVVNCIKILRKDVRKLQISGTPEETVRPGAKAIITPEGWSVCVISETSQKT